jgi:hypothetical protein
MSNLHIYFFYFLSFVAAIYYFFNRDIPSLIFMFGFGIYADLQCIKDGVMRIEYK